MNRTHLVIPDSHATPEENNDRFIWLGKLIVDLKPDVIVNLGDQADMASLCNHDLGMRSAEGRRYNDDINANIDANVKMFGEIYMHNEKQRSDKKKLYKPETYMCLGNHEDRINRLTNEQANLFGTIKIEDLGNEIYWDVVSPYKTPIVVDGIQYCHVFTKGLMDRPIGGVNAARSILIEKGVSCISGHSHVRNMAEHTRGDGKRISSLVGGNYTDFHMDYAGNANALWWSGVIILRNVADGAFDHEWVSIKTIKDRYK